MTFASNFPKLNLDEMIGEVLTEDIRRKSMGITIDDSTEAHMLTESIDRFNHSTVTQIHVYSLLNELVSKCRLS